jgi:hypothetical protein
MNDRTRVVAVYALTAVAVVAVAAASIGESIGTLVPSMAFAILGGFAMFAAIRSQHRYAVVILAFVVFALFLLIDTVTGRFSQFSLIAATGIAMGAAGLTHRIRRKVASLRAQDP